MRRETPTEYDPSCALKGLEVSNSSVRPHRLPLSWDHTISRDYETSWGASCRPTRSASLAVDSRYILRGLRTGFIGTGLDTRIAKSSAKSKPSCTPARSRRMRPRELQRSKISYLIRGADRDSGTDCNAPRITGRTTLPSITQVDRECVLEKHPVCAMYMTHAIHFPPSRVCRA